MSEPAPTPDSPPPPAKKSGCLRKTLIGCGTLLILGVVVIGLSMWPFIERRQRADRFGEHVKVGQTVTEVFAGPREWNDLVVFCAAPDGKTRRVDVWPRHGVYEAYQPERDSESATYPTLDAALKDLAAGAGPFAGRSEIHLAYRYYVQSRTYILTLGPDGKVAKIERVSRQ